MGSKNYIKRSHNDVSRFVVLKQNEHRGFESDTGSIETRHSASISTKTIEVIQHPKPHIPNYTRKSIKAQVEPRKAQQTHLNDPKNVY